MGQGSGQGGEGVCKVRIDSYQNLDVLLQSFPVSSASQLHFFDYFISHRVSDNPKIEPKFTCVHLICLSYIMDNLISGKLWNSSWRLKKVGAKGAGSFHIHRKTMKELGTLAVLGVREQPNLAQNLVTHRH